MKHRKSQPPHSASQPGDIYPSTGIDTSLPNPTPRIDRTRAASILHYISLQRQSTQNTSKQSNKSGYDGLSPAPQDKASQSTCTPPSQNSNAVQRLKVRLSNEGLSCYRGVGMLVGRYLADGRRVRGEYISAAVCVWKGKISWSAYSICQLSTTSIYLPSAIAIDSEDQTDPL
ncbi:hypothetical protein DL98DRAFT_107263 [Cadophora sp. DSE1049]|nr:hypothetical protein DL98DRAFT_107263 [Cadophora sp. DSE1049]